jgi:DNA-directed RNA polymerase specialized sigma24 family protein
VDGGWRPDGGTAITTYFTNALLLEFSNVLNVWKRQQRTFGVVTDDLPYGIPPHGDVDERSQVLEELRSLKPREREIVALHYDGYTHAEIRELTGATSERAVEGVLYRWRSKHARYREQSGGEQ